MAVLVPTMIIGQAMPFGAGANGSLALSSTAQAAAGSGWVPPAGSHRSVQCLAAALAEPLTLMSRDTFGAVLPDAAVPLGAAVLPHAVAAAAQTAAIRT